MPQQSATATPVISTVDALRRLGACRDDEAWTAILSNHGSGILRLAERMGGTALADDCCQETLLQIRANAAQFSVPPGVRDAEGAARGWVMCIAYRTALGMLRRNQRRINNERQAVLRREQETPAAPDETLLSNEQFEILRREVAGLPDALRSALCLHYYAELSYSDVSSALACSEEAVRKRVERGVTELRGRLAMAGVALGVGALTGILAGTTANAAAAAAGTVTSAVAIKQFGAWQALLHSSQAPAIAGLVKIGGLAIMGKYIVGAAALVALMLSGVQTWRISNLSSELAELQSKAAPSVELQERVNTMERNLASVRGESAALAGSLNLRNEELVQIQKRLQSYEQNANRYTAFVPDGGLALHAPKVQSLPANVGAKLAEELEMQVARLKAQEANQLNQQRAEQDMEGQIARQQAANKAAIAAAEVEKARRQMDILKAYQDAATKTQITNPNAAQGQWQALEEEQRRVGEKARRYEQEAKIAQDKAEAVLRIDRAQKDIFDKARVDEAQREEQIRRERRENELPADPDNARRLQAENVRRALEAQRRAMEAEQRALEAVKVQEQYRRDPEKAVKPPAPPKAAPVGDKF